MDEATTSAGEELASGAEAAGVPLASWTGVEVTWSVEGVVEEDLFGVSVVGVDVVGVEGEATASDGMLSGVEEGTATVLVAVTVKATELAKEKAEEEASAASSLT